ncbi:hypothetical protein, partial [Pseudomonas aeruginosa]|uniref:hypothetical protein n=1 Tax=Pseudomonas aeruginosa TaxID=287 RepID=UPI001C37AA1C
MPSPKPLGAIVEDLVSADPSGTAGEQLVEPSTSITPAGPHRRRRFRVKRRAPGSSERLHRSGERT